MIAYNLRFTAKPMRALLIAISLTALLIPRAQGAEAASGSVPSVTDARYFAGANVPWFNWACDFGCGPGGGGVSSTDSQAALSDAFGRLHAAGIHTVRWWTFEGDPKQINRDASGAPTGLNPGVYADFDAALALADKYDLAYDFVLFSAPTAIPQTWSTDPAQRQRLADALAPLFDRYKNNPHILAWEIFNEPEWDIWNNKIPQAPVQATVKLLADTVHAHTSNAVTVGSGSLEGLPLWVGQDLDFYSPHWYDPQTSPTDCARCTDAPTLAARYGLGTTPIALGEFYAGPDTDALQRWKDFRAKGYAGAWGWSYFADRTGDKLKIDLNAVTQFTSAGIPAPAPTLAAPAASPTVSLSTSWLSPTYVMSGQSITLNQDVVSSQSTQVQIKFEIDDSSGQPVSQVNLGPQQLSAQDRASFSTTLTLSPEQAAGTYIAKAAILSADGSSQLATNDAVGSFILDTSNLVPEPAPSSPDEDSIGATDDPSTAAGD